MAPMSLDGLSLVVGIIAGFLLSTIGRWKRSE